MDMRLALAFLMLVTMATAFNLRKQFRPKNDERTGNQIPDFENDRTQETSCEACGEGTCCYPDTCYDNFCYPPMVPAKRTNKKEIPDFENDRTQETSCEACGEGTCCSPDTCYNNFCYPPMVPAGRTNKEISEFENDPASGF